MTEEQKKRLMKFIGECWHEYPGRGWPIRDDWFALTTRGERKYNNCISCGISARFARNNRAFFTWDDLGACKDALVREGLWDGFYSFVHILFREDEKNYRQFHFGEDFVRWLFRPVNEAGEAHFCALVAECPVVLKFMEAKDGQK